MSLARADRIAEACADDLPEEIIKEYWAYAQDESITKEDFMKENYRGIRPAPGYPACPDHQEKKTIFKLLDVENRIGVSLTENLAMTPAASVSGYYFSHPESRYFAFGNIKEDPLYDYFKRLNITEEVGKKWLRKNLI